MKSKRSIWVGAVALAALAVSSPGLAAPPPSVVTNPDWLERPSGEDVAEAYPELGNVLNIAGRALVSCQIDSYGALENCKLDSAEPTGLGFGEAALSLTTKFRMQPKLIDGRPVEGGRVRIPIRFNPRQYPAPSDKATVAGRTPEAARRAASMVLAAPGISQELYGELWDSEFDAPGVDPALAEAARKVLADLRPAFAERFRDALASAYATTFSTRDLEDIAAFLATPTGQLTVSRQVTAGPRLKEAMAYLTTQILQQARAEFCVARNCDSTPTPSDLRQLEATAVSIESPEWSEVPDGRQTFAAYPLAPKVLRVGGWGLLSCKVGPLGLLADCRVLLDRPEGLGFGAAAMSLSGGFRLAPRQMVQGAAGETVSVTVNFPAAAWPPNAPRPATPPPSRASNLARELAAEERQTASELGRMVLAAIFDSEERAQSAVEASADARAALDRALTASTPLLMDEILRAYLDVYSEAQMGELLAFQRSAVGRAWQAGQVKVGDAIEPALATIERDMSLQARKAFCETRKCDLN